MDRRTLLKTLTLGAGGLLLPLGSSGWAYAADTATPSKRLVVVMLRGAVDGLSVVVPHGDSDYYHARDAIAIARPGSDGGALDLNGYFGMHPALAPLQPLWQQKRLAFVHACGSPDPTRSHFDAQNYLESGTPGNKNTIDGWMNRLLAQLPAPHPPTQGLGLGPVLPLILSGNSPVANVPLGRAAGKPTALDRPAVGTAFDALYAGNDALAQAYQTGRAAQHEIQSNMQGMDDYAKEMRAADNGAPAPKGFTQDAHQLAELMQRDTNIRVAFMALGGWDTHVNQGNGKGQLANHLAPLAQGLATLAQSLGPSLDDTLIVVMSEFGRTVKQNGNGGTDHGHGNVMWLIGGNLTGGKIYGDWPTLASNRLYQQRDLAVTTDFRSVLAVAMERHLRLNDAQLTTVLPHLPERNVTLDRLFRA